MLGDNIRKYRKENNISQEELAEKLGVTRQSISLWENNQTQPSLENIVALSKIFNVTTDNLLATSEVLKEADITKTNPIEKKPITRKTIILTVIVTVALVIILGLFFVLKPLFNKSFSEDSNAIASAEKSVVKIICYDFDGNESATGSGFILFDEKTIITNYHVMEEAYTCKILTNTEAYYNVDKIVAYSEENDIAILSLKKGTGLQPLKRGSSVDIEKGENVIAIGSPLGIENVISQGIISGKITEDNIESILFTAPISHGSSGGALFNNNGEVIGVTYGSYEDGQNLNLAIPIEIVEKLYSEKTAKINVDTIYKKAHPYVDYLSEYSNAIPVTFEALKLYPERYKGQLVKIDTYISSIYFGTATTRYYFSNREYCSGNNEYDDNLRTSSGVTIPYENVMVMSTGMVASELCSYFDNTIKEYDNVVIIGVFNYGKVGEISPITGFASKVEYGSIDVDIIYKK